MRSDSFLDFDVPLKKAFSAVELSMNMNTSDLLSFPEAASVSKNSTKLASSLQFELSSSEIVVVH